MQYESCQINIINELGTIKKQMNAVICTGSLWKKFEGNKKELQFQSLLANYNDILNHATLNQLVEYYRYKDFFSIEPHKTTVDVLYQRFINLPEFELQSKHYMSDEPIVRLCYICTVLEHIWLSGMAGKPTRATNPCKKRIKDLCSKCDVDHAIWVT
jgi:hypothetical protein